MWGGGGVARERGVVGGSGVGVGEAHAADGVEEGAAEGAADGG